MRGSSYLACNSSLTSVLFSKINLCNNRAILSPCFEVTPVTPSTSVSLTPNKEIIKKGSRKSLDMIRNVTSCYEVSRKGTRVNDMDTYKHINVAPNTSPLHWRANPSVCVFIYLSFGVLLVPIC